MGNIITKEGLLLVAKEMKSYKKKRDSEDIKRELSTIINQLKDPRLKSEMVSVVRVEVSNDFSYCKIYISDLNGYDQAMEDVKILKNAKGFIRHMLSERLEIRHTPDLIFSATDSIEQGAHISKILEDLKKH